MLDNGKNEKYPTLLIDREKLLKNSRDIVRIAQKSDCRVWGVTKGLAGHPEVARVFLEAGAEGIADSRLANLKRMRADGITAPMMLIRIPMLSELEELPLYADISLASDMDALFMLDAICLSHGCQHGVILMIDMGDLREGFCPGELKDAARKLRQLKGGVRVLGVGANFACASGVLPSREKLEAMVAYRDEVQREIGYPLEIISCGGTCCLELFEQGLVPKGINHFRVGEAMFLGIDSARMRTLPPLHRDSVRIAAQVVEVRCKPSKPDGKIGADAMGHVVVFEDRGIRKRVLLGIGKQDISIEGLIPVDPGVEIVTASSDHLILDVEKATRTFHYGDVVEFHLHYAEMMSAAVSPYMYIRVI